MVDFTSPIMLFLVIQFIINWGKLLFEFRAYSRKLLRAIIAHNHLSFFKIFSNFCTFSPLLNIFLPFFWKIAWMPLLSRIGPGGGVRLTFQDGVCKFKVVAMFFKHALNDLPSKIELYRYFIESWSCDL